MTTDITFNGKGYMLEGQGLALVQSALPAAVSVGGGEQYADNSSWSAVVLSQLNLGIGFESAGNGGFRYGTADTGRLAKTTLPQKVTAHDLAGNGEVHFTTYNKEVYAVRGLIVYKWSGSAWTTFATLPAGPDATDIAAFDEYLHVGRGTTVNYHAVYIPTAALSVGPHPAEIVYQWGGWIFTAAGPRVHYSNGGHSTCGAVTPTPATPYDPLTPNVPGWQWVEIALGPCDNSELVTGLAGMYVGSLSSTRLFISTTRQLYMVLPGDVAVSGLLEWPTVGEGMIAWRNELYIPVGQGLTRYSPSGSTFAVGLDQNFGLPSAKAGPVQWLTPTPTGVTAAIKGTVYAYSGEGWRYIAAVADDVDGLYYDPFTDDLLIGHNGKVSRVAMRSYASQVVGGPHMLTAEVDYGDLYGGLRLLQKDYHEIVINGDFPTGTSLTVHYSVDGSETKILLGTVNEDGKTLSFACNGASRPIGRSMRLWVTLTTTNEAVTPVLEGLVLRFLPDVTDRARWTYALSLPKDCLLDGCGNPVSGYNQAEWDCAIRAAVGGPRPVAMVDFDGRSYSVKVTDWSYRIENREITNGTVSFDKFWTLSLLETCGPGMACT